MEIHPVFRLVLKLIIYLNLSSDIQQAIYATHVTDQSCGLRGKMTCKNWKKSDHPIHPLLLNREDVILGVYEPYKIPIGG